MLNPVNQPGRGNSARRVRNPTPGPWVDWKVTNRAARCIKFIQSYCRPPKGEGWGKTMKLAPWQKAWIREMFAPGIRSAVMSLPRGQGKSTLSAAIAVWALFDDTSTGAPSVPIIATTVGQAARSVYDVAVAMVNAEPELADRSLVFTAIGNSRVFVPFTGGTMFPMANDVDGLQGLDPSVAVADEIGFQPVLSWDSLVLASGKRQNSLVLGLGTPGLDRNNALWNLREKVMAGVAIPGFVYKEYAADPGCKIDDLAQWKKANPALKSGFLKVDALRLSLAMSPESHFRVFRLGQWHEGTDNWLGPDGAAIWDALEDPYELVKGAPTWVGVDAAITRDTTAVAAAQLRKDGRIHISVRIWTPKVDEPVDLNDVMAYIRTLADTYKVGAVAFDPRFMDWPAKVLYDEGIPMVEVPQSVERLTPVIGDLWTLIKEGGLSHDKDPLFRSHVLNAIARPNERGFTLSKGKSRGHIDGAIAMALAVDRVRNKGKPKPPVVVL